MNLNEYAKHRGVSLRAVQKAIETERITVTYSGAHKKIDPETADKEWVENATQPTKFDHEADDEELKKRGVPSARTSDAVIKAYKARLAKLELKQKENELIEKSNIYNQLSTTTRIIRESLLQIPLKLAPEITSMTEPHDIENRLYDEIERVLNELSELADRYK